MSKCSGPAGLVAVEAAVTLLGLGLGFSLMPAVAHTTRQ